MVAASLSGSTVGLRKGGGGWGEWGGGGEGEGGGGNTYHVYKAVSGSMN